VRQEGRREFMTLVESAATLGSQRAILTTTALSSAHANATGSSLSHSREEFWRRWLEAHQRHGRCVPMKEGLIFYRRGRSRAGTRSEGQKSDPECWALGPEAVAPGDDDGHDDGTSARAITLWDFHTAWVRSGLLRLAHLHARLRNYAVAR